MNDRTVLFTANAGFFVTVSGVTFAVDAFPQKADRGFCALSEEHFQQLCQSPDPVHYVIATHDHNDHYHKDWNEQFLNNHPRARFIGAVGDDQVPKTSHCQAEPSILLRSPSPTYYLPKITFEFLRLAHEGAEYANVDNYGCLVTIGSCRILFLGDAKPADPAIAQWIGGRSIDLALLNFPWIALPKGRQFIQERLPHTRIGVIHLPYEDSDRNHYVDAARNAVSRFDTHEVTLFTRFGQEMAF